MGPAHGSTLMLLSDLRDKPVRALDGKRLGRVHEVHCEKGRVVALVCGARSLIERWTDKPAGRRIPWEWVRKVAANEIVVALDAAERRASGSRSRRRTRPASGRRSTR